MSNQSEQIKELNERITATEQHLSHSNMDIIKSFINLNTQINKLQEGIDSIMRYLMERDNCAESVLY